MLQSKFLKQNWNKLSKIILVLGILSIISSILFNRSLIEKYFVADHLIEYPNTFYVYSIQIIALIIGILFILFYLYDKKIKNYLKNLKSTPWFVYAINFALIGFILFLIIFHWQDHTVDGEGELFNNISFVSYLVVAVLCFINFLLLKHKKRGYFFEKEKNFWIIFSICFFLLGIIDYTNIHEIFQDWFLSITSIPLNAATMEIHALIPLTVGIIAFFSFIFFFHKLKNHKTMLIFFYIGITIAIIGILVDLINTQPYIEESLEMLMSFFFIPASLIAFFDNL